MPHPTSKIRQTSTILVPAAVRDGQETHSTLETTALCEDGTVWTITRIPSTGQFTAWVQYPAIPHQGVSNA